MYQKEIVVTAKFIGRKIVNVTATTQKKTEETLLVLPFNKQEELTMDRLDKAAKDFAEKGMDVSAGEIWNAIATEARRIKKAIPKKITT